MKCEDIWKMTGLGSYEYDLLCVFEESQVQGYCQSTRVRAAAIAKAWSPDLATEWASRNYLSVKMILASQLMFNAAYYARQKNLRIVDPYLIYYALLSACRALVFSDLFLEWREGDLRTIGHDRIRNEAVNVVRRLSKERANEVETFAQRARKQRELFSYSFPAQGVRSSGPELSITEACSIAALLCELAEANSECLEAAWLKHSGLTCQVEWNSICDLCMYDGSPVFSDDDDAYRISYLSRKYRGPSRLSFVATAGMIDDFYGAWCASDEQDVDSDGFNPDHSDAPGIFSFS